MKAVLSGNEAIARGAYEHGVGFASAYPGTPSTEILENIKRYDDIESQWSANEKVAFEVAMGASVGGLRSLTAMKHVGVNVAADPLFTFAYTGVNGGFILVSADDPGMHSSQNEQDNRMLAKAAKIPVLEPSDSQEAKDFVGYALEISEKFDTPVLLRMTTRVSHSKSVVTLGERTFVRKEYKKDFNKFISLPSNARKLRVTVEERLENLKQFGETFVGNKMEINERRVGIITSGIAYQYAKEVMPNASFLKLGLSYPLPDRLVREFASKVDRLYVIEELDPVIEEQVRNLGIEVLGKDVIPGIGELNPDLIRKALLNEERSAEGEELPVRLPVLCPGCGHRAFFYTLKKNGIASTGDIGCYTLGAYPPLDAIDTCFCMGASVTAALGLEKANGQDFARKWVAVLGDSTFIHSGITGLIDVLYNGGTTTVCILDNHITAMTGHQQNPATGKNIKNQPTKQLDIQKLVEAVGVEHVRVVDPNDLAALERTILEEVARPEPSVVIVRRPCVLIEKANRKPFRVENCKKCGACFKLGCPAIEKQEKEAVINPVLCTGCGVCQQLCKFNSISQEAQ
ncbi:MAG: indolepyruvate ferredoxin oxidoreductase subunit alpha [Bacteroidota bacterium]